MDNSNHELVLKILQTQAEMSVHIAEIKVDLKYHIRRTTLLEAEVSYNKKQIFMAQGAIALIGLTGIIVGVLKSLGFL